MSALANLDFRRATVDDAKALTALHVAAAEQLTCLHGSGPWSTKASEKGILLALRSSQIIVAYQRDELVATFRLATKKPWAIDTRHFANSRNPLYLLAMAVAPAKQRCGIGRRCLEEAKAIARAEAADAIRLDAYNADAGAGGFYADCGWTEVGRATYRNIPLIYYEYLLTE